MKKVLVVNSNPKPEAMSYGLRLASHYVNEIQAANADVEVTTLNLYEEHIPMIDGEVLDAWGKAAQGADLSQGQQAVLARMNDILEQFLAADMVVFVSAMWNLSYPPLLKAYIDNVVIAGRTFRYTAEGPQGLITDKKVVHIEARGGDYSQAPGFQFANNYLQAVMGFIGITEYENVVVEGMNATPDKAEEILEAAKVRASESVKRHFALV
ncbi:MAG: NAD(P)H-dependent oxidoreductase [Paenibacillus sp.]|uniref:FMN dependent NADH:quinone oxidoreductase n=1 Tax=Paenibacillus aquistagni TaxID=1852522 RepID=A0A1X7LKR7_9BACL|nr:NAD(P)H-dependent oxidoreductase [Paenibacillus aquistagni]MBR2569421.1 NAD(P)H-dependent oxidoreductase [Paenibacillus sp.]SMG54476.1 FMN-dependent NADH-azoreductase [Paenibacillus aquistagni]